MKLFYLVSILFLCGNSYLKAEDLRIVVLGKKVGQQVIIMNLASWESATLENLCQLVNTVPSLTHEDTVKTFRIFQLPHTVITVDLSDRLDRKLNSIFCPGKTLWLVIIATTDNPSDRFLLREIIRRKLERDFPEYYKPEESTQD